MLGNWEKSDTMLSAIDRHTVHQVTCPLIAENFRLNTCKSFNGLTADQILWDDKHLTLHSNMWLSMTLSVIVYCTCATADQVRPYMSQTKRALVTSVIWRVAAFFLLLIFHFFIVAKPLVTAAPSLLSPSGSERRFSISAEKVMANVSNI